MSNPMHGGSGYFVLHFAQNLSGMGGPTSSKGAASIVCEFAGACKLPYLTTYGFHNVKIPWRQCRHYKGNKNTNNHREYGQ